MTRSFAPLYPTNYLQPPITGICGRLVEGEHHVIQARASEGASKNGLLMVPGTDHRKQAQHPPALPTDDNDAIKTTFNSSASDQTFTATDFNGTIGAGRITPARAITFTATLNAAQFGAVDIEVVGYDANGNPVKDLIRYDGSTLDTPFPTAIAFSGAVRIFVPAGAGATGEGEFGVSDDVVEYGGLDVLGLNLYISHHEPAETAGYDHDDLSGLNIAIKGLIECNVETTAATAVVYGDEVWVRVVEVGSDIRGQLTGPQAPGGNFAKLHGAKWELAAAAGEQSFVRVDW